jgi:hypothetical protein
MDNAVALVQAYLRVNGYFTVTEYPAVEAMKSGAFRTATDLDLLAFRFPAASGPIVVSRARTSSEHTFAPDPELGIAAGEADMLVGEVKEGRARLNEGAANPAVLRHVLTRFGCCPAEHAPRRVDELLSRGQTVLPSGHRLRLVSLPTRRDRSIGRSFSDTSFAFSRVICGSTGRRSATPTSRTPAFGFLVTVEKALAGSAPEGGRRDARPGKGTR